MSGVAIGISAAVLGAGATVYAADRASKDQRRAADQSTQLQRSQYDQTRQDQQPWREAGEGALSDLTTGLGEGGQFTQNFGQSDFKKDEGYQFRMNEGLKAIDASAAARGGLNSGRTLKALTKYGQGFASNEYQNAYNRYNNDQSNQFNRLSNLAGIGQTANNQLGQAGQNYANQASGNINASANASAANSMAQANALNGAITQGTNQYIMSQYLKK